MLRYIKLGYYFTKEVTYYSYTLIIRNFWFIFVVFLVTNLALYGAEHKGLSHIGGIAIGTYIWYVFVTEIIMINWRDPDLINDIKNGNILIYLNKPINFILLQIINSFFRTLVKVFFISVFGFIVVILFVKSFPYHGIIHFIIFLLSMLIGILMLSLISFSWGLIAFIIEDSQFIRWFLNKAYMIFGGVFFPLEIYPTWLRVISENMPFAYFIYSPAKFFVTGDVSFFLYYFPKQLFWLLFLLFLNIYIYSKVTKKLEINGG